MAKTQLQHSSYWLGGHSGDSSIDLAARGSSMPEIVRLASIKQAISNFVRIATGRRIPVRFNSGADSYTDGKVVIISASTRQKSFDAVVGLALHEATHCVHSYYPDFLQQYGDYAWRMIPQETGDKAGHLKMDDLRLMHAIKMLTNIFEDRRIDWWQYREAPGYRPYYEAMYNQYWHGKQIDCALQQGLKRDPTVDNYMFHILNMTNPWFDTRALPDLDVIYGMIDVDNISRFDHDAGYDYVNKQVKLASPRFELDKMPHIFQLAIGVFNVVLDNCLAPPMKQSAPSACAQPGGSPQPNPEMEDNLDLGGVPAPDGAGAGGSGGGASQPKDDESDSDEQPDSTAAEGDTDGSDSSGSVSPDGKPRKDKHAAETPAKSGKVVPKKLQKDIEKQQNFLDGKVEKKKISERDDQRITAIEKAGSNVVSVNHEANYGGMQRTEVLVLRNLTRSLMESGAFPFVEGIDYRYGRYGTMTMHRRENVPIMTENQYSRTAVTDGFRMGAILAQRLSVRNQNQLMRFNRRQEGKIDRRRLHALGSGDVGVFYRTKLTEYEPVLVHMTIDASGSMCGLPWQKSLAVGIAVAVAAHKIENLDFVLSLRAGCGLATVAIIYDSRVDTPTKIKQLYPFLSWSGGTPEGLCFAAIMDELTATKHGERYFVNLSDGMPMFGSYGGESAHRHTREQINRLRGEGIKVLSYFINERSDSYYSSGRSPRDAFKVMYGKDASFVDVASIPSLASTLNKLFLER